MARKGTSLPPRPHSTRAQRRRLEQRTQRLAIVVGIVVLLGIAAIPLCGYYNTFVSPPKSTVVRVNDVSFSLGYLFKLLRMNATMSKATGSDISVGSLPFYLMQDIEDGELIKQAAPTLGLSVSDEEATQEMKNRLVPPPAEGEQTDPAQLEREFKERLRNFLTTIQISEGEYRELVKKDLLRSKLGELLSKDVPTIDEQVNVQMIRVNSQETMDSILGRLKAGEDFGAVADDVSMAKDSTEAGGSLGWLPHNVFPIIDELLFSLEVGKVSAPLPLSDGLYLFKVTDKAGAMPISDQNKEILTTRAADNWLAQERKSAEIYRCFGQRSPGAKKTDCNWQYDWLMENLSSSGS